MAELSPCSSIKSTSTAHYDSDYSEEEFDTDSQKELRSLITKLDLSVTSEQIYETLLVIRSDYSNVDDPTVSGLSTLLNGKEGIDLAIKLLALLERPNSKVVDVSLSILGNLAMFSKPRDAMTSHKGVNVLVKIISSLAEEKILGRACRVIANLAMNETATSGFHSKETVRLLQKTLRDVQGAKAKGAAIRAIRILCEKKGKNRKICAETNAIALIMTTLLETNDIELIKIIVKSIAILTDDTHRNSGACGSKEANNILIQQIEEGSNEFLKLIELMSSDQINISGASHKISRHIWIPAMTVLANLSYHQNLRPKLGNSGIIPAFVKRLQNNDTVLSSKQFFQGVNALCLYCQESVNRLKLRELGGLQYFVSILSSNKPHHRAVHKKVLESLVRFGYDNISMKYLDYAGVVPSLIGLLNEYVDLNRHIHECDKEESKKSIDASKTSDNSIGATPEQHSRKSSNSVFLDIDQLLERNKSNDSSNVQSEIDENQSNTSLTETSIQLGSDNNDSLVENSFEADGSADNYGCYYNKKIDWVLQILLKLCETPPLSDSMTEVHIVKAVVQYLCWTKYDVVTHRRAGLILTRISKCLESIMPYLHQSFFPWLRLELDQRLQNSDFASCMPCKTLNNLFTNVIQSFIFTAESGYIEGKVCHTLVAPGAADEATRSIITVGIISLLTCKTLLFNILVTHGGLEVLLQTLETQSSAKDITELFAYAVLSIHLLAQRVDVVSSIDDRPLILDKYQQTNENCETLDSSKTTSCFYKQCKKEKNLILKFDDGSKIKANKEVIVEANNVFEAMLVGRFSEANQTEVLLPKTSASAMLRIVHYLYGCRRWAGKDGCCRYSPGLIGTSTEFAQPANVITQYEDDLEMLLELVPLSDKYLLTDLSIFVNRMIVSQCTQSPETKMQTAYRRSLNIFCPTIHNLKNDEDQTSSSVINNQDNILYASTALNIKLVAFLLSGNIPNSTRTKLFWELVKSDSGISADFVDDVNQIILSSLKAAMLKPKPLIVKQYSSRSNPLKI